MADNTREMGAVAKATEDACNEAAGNGRCPIDDGTALWALAYKVDAELAERDTRIGELEKMLKDHTHVEQPEGRTCGECASFGVRLGCVTGACDILEDVGADHVMRLATDEACADHFRERTDPAPPEPQIHTGIIPPEGIPLGELKIDGPAVAYQTGSPPEPEVAELVDLLDELDPRKRGMLHTQRDLEKLAAIRRLLTERPRLTERQRHALQDAIADLAAGCETERPLREILAMFPEATPDAGEPDASP